MLRARGAVRQWDLLRSGGIDRLRGLRPDPAWTASKNMPHRSSCVIEEVTVLAPASSGRSGPEPFTLGGTGVSSRERHFRESLTHLYLWLRIASASKRPRTSMETCGNRSYLSRWIVNNEGVTITVESVFATRPMNRLLTAW